ncbi:MAG: CRISPR-associated DxTHG motif protein [Anaerolineae bacterium]|nr:CRISPR-associated DxTHG motif protein [Anaerolineae bacterium]
MVTHGLRFLPLQ